MERQQQQTHIMNFFKRAPKEATEGFSPQQAKPQSRQGQNEENAETQEKASGRKSCDKRPPGDDDKADAVDVESSTAAKRPRLSTETPPRPSLAASPPLRSPFAPSPFAPSPAAGKENQLVQFLADQPAAVRALLVDFGPSWLPALKPELVKAYFVKLAEFVQAERSSGRVIYPPPGDVFTWTRACRMLDVKVVILGQDPYIHPNQAHGLCFSVRRPTTPPPSLLNIYKEAAANFPDGFQRPGHGDLTGWAEQGVLLLNAVLTVRRGESNSHKDRGWEAFTDAVVSALSSRCSGLVFILWGSYAQKKGARIDKRRHKVLCGAHPSPMSANQGGFFSKMYFKEANDYLKSAGKTPIDWGHLP